MTNVGMGPAFWNAGHHRQDRLFAVECLNLALLVNAQNQRAIGWRQVKANDIAHFVDEQRITRELEGLAAMGLESEGSPDPADRGVRKTRRGGHRADRPVCCIARQGTQRALDHGGYLIVVDRPRPARTSFIQ